MATSRSKRWNGKLDTLAADYLQQVLAQMAAYGDQVQFALTTPGAKPNYQVQNNANKKMAFDGNHHLMQAQEAEFEGSNATALLTLEQIQAAGAGISRSAIVKQAKPPKPSKPSKSAARTTTATAKAADLVDAAKYAYFKANRSSLPAGINAHTDEISVLMRNGLAAEAAFADIIQRYF